MKKNLMTTVIICAALFYVLGIAGGLEQELMTFGQAIIRWLAALAVITSAFVYNDSKEKKK